MSTSTSGNGWDAFYFEAVQAAVAWKATTTSLPREAKKPGRYGKGTYDFCLPTPWARHNLLLEAREIAVDRFTAADVRWHRELQYGPCNHLLSSQVQCVNALAPFVDDPEALAAIFGSFLPIAQVLPFGSTSSSSFR